MLDDETLSRVLYCCSSGVSSGVVEERLSQGALDLYLASTMKGRIVNAGHSRQRVGIFYAGDFRYRERLAIRRLNISEIWSPQPREWCRGR